MAESYEEYLARAKLAGPLESSGSPAFDWLRGAGVSAASAIPEMFGNPPMQGASEFRLENPIAGTVTQILGTAVPYAGWWKATKLVKPFERGIQKLGDLQKAPVLTGMAREAARFAPFEAGRVGISQVNPWGNVPFSDMATDAVVSLSLGAGIGGLVQGVAAAGTRAPAFKLMGGVDTSAPAPLILRGIRAKIASGTLDPAQVPGATYAANKMEEAVRAEKAKRGRYVFGTNMDKALNTFFDPFGRGSTSVDRRRFVAKMDTDFADEAAWRAAATAAGLPPNFPELGQYFRHISFKGVRGAKLKTQKYAQQLGLGTLTPKIAQQLAKTLQQTSPKMAKVYDDSLTKGMQSIGNNWFMTKEKDGLYVMAKKVQGAPGVPQVTDEWVLFKTDDPGKFEPSAQRWAQVVTEKNAWTPGAAPLLNLNPIYDAGYKFKKEFNPRDMPAQTAKGAFKHLTVPGLKGQSLELSERLKEGAREYLAPTVYQFSGNWDAQHAWTAAKVMHDAAQELGDLILYGRQEPPSGKTIFHQALKTDKTYAGKENVRAAVESLSEEEVQKHVWPLWRNKIDPESLDSLVQAGQIRPEVATAVQTLQQLSDQTWKWYDGLLEILGRKPPKYRRGWIGLERVWEGDLRIAIRNAAGQLEGIASGPNRRTARKNAERLAKDINGGQIAEEFDLSQSWKELPEDVRKFLAGPDYLLEKHNIRGYKFDLDPFTKKELMKAYEQAYRRKFNHQQALAVEDQMAPDLEKIAASDPATFRMLDARLRDLRGEPSSFSRWQNRLADQFLAPVIGTDSASKIVSWTNTAQYVLNLGMGKLSFPILNALTFPQTVIAESAFLMSGIDEATSGYYSYIQAYGSNGKPVGALGFLNPFTIQFKSMRDMARPTPEQSAAFGRAVKERVIAPRFVEEFIGESATKVTELRKAYSERDILGWLQALNDFLPGNSERMARSHAFIVGYNVAKDILKITDEDQIYLVAKQFTEKTMYGYATADRPRIFTTPAGSALGLFKTWMFNYMASMAEYSRVAATNPTNLWAWAPLLWQTAGTAAMGGAAATPLYWLADGFSRGFADKSLIQATYDMYEGGWEGDAIMFGLPAILSGGYISLYSNVQSPASNPIRDANMLFSVASLDRGVYLGQAMGAAFDHWQATGEHPGRSPQTRDLLARALAPATWQRSMSAFMDEDRITSLGTGYPLLTDVTIGERIAYAAGFNPVQLDRAMVVSDELYRDQAKRRERTTQLGRAYAEAQKLRDSDQMQFIMRQAFTWGINPAAVLRSSLTRLRGEQQSQVERAFTARKVQEMRNVLGR